MRRTLICVDDAHTGAVRLLMHHFFCVISSLLSERRRRGGKRDSNHLKNIYLTGHKKSRLRRLI